MERQQKKYEHLAGQKICGRVRARHSQSRAIIQYGTTDETVIIDIPQDLSHKIIIGTNISLIFDEKGQIQNWTTSCALS